MYDEVSFDDAPMIINLDGKKFHKIFVLASNCYTVGGKLVARYEKNVQVPADLRGIEYECPGGRDRRVIFVPDGWWPDVLSSREAFNLAEEIYSRLGLSSFYYMAPASVHSYWKRRQNQAVVLRPL